MTDAERNLEAARKEAKLLVDKFFDDQLLHVRKTPENYIGCTKGDFLLWLSEFGFDEA